MSATVIARSYAETLFELAQRHEGIDAFAEAMELVDRTLGENPDVRLFLETPRVDTAAKKRVLRAALEDRVPRNFLHFILIVVDKRRQRFLPEIAAAFRALLDEHLGRVHVEVTLAREPEAAVVEEIARRVSEMLQKEAIPHVRVKPGILGGMVMKVGDTVYDGSLQRKMSRMRRRLLAASLPSAQ